MPVPSPSCLSDPQSMCYSILSSYRDYSTMFELKSNAFKDKSHRFGDTDHTVKAVRLNHRLDAVGNQFATGQRILHADMTHCDTVIYADSIKLEWNATSGANSFFDELAEGLQVDMARHHVYIGIAHGDEGFIEIIFPYCPG